jgi:xylulokinase
VAGSQPAASSSGPADGCVLAIDLGTSGVKVGLVTPEGHVLAAEAEPVATQLGPGGSAEQRPADWWAATATASRRLLADRAAERPAILAVGLTAQWAGTVAVDAHAEPLCAAIIWLDGRGAPYARRLVGGAIRVAGYDPRKLARWVRRTGGAPALSGRDPFGHILWLRAERPDVYRRAAHLLEPVDWLGARLTGRIATTGVTATLHWITDARDPRAIRYDDELVRLAGLRREQLPELLEPNAVLGHLTASARRELGLERAVPVAAGTPDLASSAVGSGAVADHAAHLYVGSSAWVSCHVPYKRTDVLHSVASLPAALPGRWLVASEQDTAGASLERLRDLLLPGSGADGFTELERLATAAAAGSGGLLFTPWLNGERTPVDDGQVRGGLHNITMATTREQVARAVFEGVALNTRWMHTAVERFCRRRLEPIAFVGGGARSALWAQIMADVLGRTVRRIGDPRSANLRGAALLALVGLGELRPDELEGRAPIAAEHAPDPATRATYDDLFAAFRGTYRASRWTRRRLSAVRDRQETSA